MLYGKDYIEYKLYLDAEYHAIDVEGVSIRASDYLEMADYTSFVEDFLEWKKQKPKAKIRLVPQIRYRRDCPRIEDRVFI